MTKKIVLSFLGLFVALTLISFAVSVFAPQLNLITAFVTDFLLILCAALIVSKLVFKNKRTGILKLVLAALVSVIICTVVENLITTLALALPYAYLAYGISTFFGLAAWVTVFVLLCKFLFGITSPLANLKKCLLIVAAIALVFAVYEAVYYTMLERAYEDMLNSGALNIFALVEGDFGVPLVDLYHLAKCAVVAATAVGISKKHAEK